MEKELLEAIRKRALGYTSREVVSEYVNQEDTLILVKERVTEKDVPPDIAAVKLYDEVTGERDVLSDEELEKEKIRLIEYLNNVQKKQRRGEKNDE